MAKFFVKEENIDLENNKVYIDGTDVNHIKNVLRLNTDDIIYICSKETHITYECKITNIANDLVCLEIINKLNNTTESNVNISIFQGLPKNEKMELIIEKSTEIGVISLTPVIMQRCVVKLDEKNKIRKVTRWQKIAEVASKQSKRDIIPKINDVIKLDDIIDKIKNFDLVLLAYENEKNISLKEELLKLKRENQERLYDSENKINIACIIGPEGGFDIKEVELLEKNGAKVITLGNRILRTETVALVMASNIIYELEN